MGLQRVRGPRVGIEVDTAALRKARVDAGLSLAQLAGTDLTRQAVHLIESGKVRPTLRSLRIIAERLGVPESALLAAPGPLADEQVIFDLQGLCQRHEYALAADQALQLIDAGGSPRRIAFAHHYAGRALIGLTQPEDALTHCRVARAAFEAQGNAWWVAESMDWEATALNMLQDGSSLRLARRALGLYRSLEPRLPETEARMLEHLGTIYYGRRSYESGRASYEAALQIAGGVRDLTRIARVYHGLGMCHQGLKDLRTAAELVFKAVTLYEAEQRITPSPTRADLPRAENDLGVIALDQGDLHRAEELFNAALEHYAAAGIERLQSHTLLSLGELRQRQQRLDEALRFTTDAIERAAALDEKYALTSGYKQLGLLYAERGDDGLADASFQRALLLCESAGLKDRATEYLRAYEQVLAERRHGRRRVRNASASA